MTEQRRSGSIRSESRANRRRLLDAAVALVAERGVGVPVHDIAAAAGVTVPTLYRHLGSKEELVRLVMEQRYSVIVDHVESALQAETGAASLHALLRSFLELTFRDRSVRQSGGSFTPKLAPLLFDAWKHAIDRGHSDGTIRGDFRVTDVPYLYAAVAGMGHFVGDSAALGGRYIELLIDAVSPAGRGRLPSRAPSRAFIQDAFVYPPREPLS